MEQNNMTNINQEKEQGVIDLIKERFGSNGLALTALTGVGLYFLGVSVGIGKGRTKGFLEGYKEGVSAVSGIVKTAKDAIEVEHKGEI